MSLLSKIGLGLKNIYNKTLNKLSALKGTPQSIAKGFATGAAMSFTPFVGFHLVLSLIVAKLTKQNGVAAALGTIVGNPWTFPFIWYLTLHTGHFMLGSEAPKLPVNFKTLFSELFHAVIKLDFNAFINDIWPVYYPMLIGCIPFYIGVWWSLSYLIKRVLTQNSNNGG
ncbi:MAG: DUF2062 domain-containing protein [Alphaproteobacteria bacterium]|nr:DUF2062 domain-containing protein [Alphaproteobacteria bacterium]